MQDIPKILAEELGLRLSQVLGTVKLLEEGATVPFIARYRKERTENLNEEKIREIAHRLEYYKELEERRETILESIASQGKMTADLEQKLLLTRSKTELEDLYLPFKPKRVTRASKAREAGLLPLAEWLLSLKTPQTDPILKAKEFLNPEKGVPSAEAALKGASDIISEEIAENAENRKWMRELALRKGEMISSVKKEFRSEKTKFEMYYDFREPVRTLPSHRVLAMLRGEKENVLKLGLILPEDEALPRLANGVLKFPQSGAAALIQEAIHDSFERLLLPATETEVRKYLQEKAEEEAFLVFSGNLRELLLSPPAGQKPVLALDPGFRTGCKVAAIDETGRFLEYRTIYPHEPHKKTEEAKKVLLEMIVRHGVLLIAVGNGTAGRETFDFAKKATGEMEASRKPVTVMVSEAGASVYSASEIAIKEFPDQDVTVRGAISIGRRLQDPLSELVKIDPKSIGVGQYQHDVNQTKLKARLEEVVESAVNKVGVNVNLASEELLKYVSGLNKKIAAGIVAHRNEHGPFHSRGDLKKVKGIGDKSFEQAAGFLRVPGSENPLDNSSVHPESYEVVRRIATELETTVVNLIGNTALIKRIPKEDFVSEKTGLLTLTDILSELEKPGRDPRETFQYASFSDTITEIAHLKEGMILEGRVTNVTNFGAFVDIGVHQDGLIHISELSNTFVRDPFSVIKVGQIVKAKVLKVDTALKRISLSLKNIPH